MLIKLIQDAPVIYVSIVMTVLISVVLHELAHGYAALAQGDDTPRVLGHITWDPLVHMGWFSIAALFLIGIAFGQMPVNPSRFRGRYGRVLVSAAGPAMNLVLALIGLTALGLWLGAAPPADMRAAIDQNNFMTFLFYFGAINVVLCAFNLLPIPPLDGSTILAGLFRPYQRLIADPRNSGIFMALFIVVFVMAPKIFGLAYEGVHAYLALFCQ